MDKNKCWYCEADKDTNGHGKLIRVDGKYWHKHCLTVYKRVQDCYKEKPEGMTQFSQLMPLKSRTGPKPKNK